MALAFLELEAADSAWNHFVVDIGSSRWFTYRIGEGNSLAEDGFEILADPSYVASLVGPLSPDALGRTCLDVPADRFDGKNHCIQLISYRAKPDIGPAVSEIVYVGRKTTEMQKPTYTSADTLIGNAESYSNSTRENAVRAFAYEEVVYSDAMFLQALVPVLSAILPVLSNMLPMLGGLFGGGQTGVSTGSNGPLSPQLLQQITDLMKQLMGTSGRAIGSSVNGEVGTIYSEAKIAPAILAALPALIPLAEKLLNPDTIKAIMDNSPHNMAAKANDQIRQHLERIMPSSDTTQWMQLLALLSQSSSLHTVMPDYQSAQGVDLRFLTGEQVSLRSRPSRLYRTDRSANFKLMLETPRAISHPKLRWQVRRAESTESLIEEECELETITSSGPLPISVTLTSADLQRLTPGDDHILCAYLLWETRSGRTLGTEATLSFMPTGDFVFDRILDGGEMLALNDVNRYRDFWHKVWQSTLTEEVTRYNYECKYYYAVDATAEQTVRGVTRIQDTPRELHTQEGRLESSMSLSLDALNGLLTDTATKPSLSEQELNALRAMAFVQQFSTAARFEARFRGKVGTSVALWVFPEVRLQSVRLLKCESADENGNVRTVGEHIVVFPMPSIAHFVGVTTDT